MNIWGDQVVKQAGHIAFRRHLWYLSAENIPRALFSDLVSMETKDKMATRLLEFETTDKPQKRIVRDEELFGKPDFPQIQNIANSALEDFVNQDSWFFFKSLKINHSFLSYPSLTWSTFPEFEEAKATVKSLHVINDSAERGVKLTSDFLHSASKEENLQNVLQVVEKKQKEKPDQCNKKKVMK